VRVVPAAAAHQVAAAHRVLRHRLVAHAAPRAQAARHRVGLAVVGRPVRVHQVRVHGLAVGVRLLDLEEFGALVAAGLDGFHVHGVRVLLLEDVAQLAELGERGPAGFGGAGARDAVTLAFQAHALLQDLDTGRRVSNRQLRKTPRMSDTCAGDQPD